MAPGFSDSDSKVFEIKDIGKRLKHAIIYICLFILFRTVFVLIIPYYINVSDYMNGPIDARTGNCRCFDQQYVQDAKAFGYNTEGYVSIYLPLDIVFPIVYTLMFFAVLNVRSNKQLYDGVFRKIYDIFFYLVLAGMIFDYLENLAFFLYLETKLEISFLVAILTTIKTLLFIVNILGFLAAIVRTSLTFLKNRKLRN